MNIIRAFFVGVRLAVQVLLRAVPFTLGWVTGCVIDGFMAGKEAGEKV